MNISYFDAEKFYRLSYDFFYYENDVKSAKKYINKALKSNPCHFKSLILKGEILLLENKLKAALKCFQSANKLSGGNSKCLLEISKAYELNKNYEPAFEYLNKISLNKIKDKNFLSQYYRLKISLLIKLNKCTQAKNTLKTLNSKLYSDDVFDIEEAFYNEIKNNNIKNIKKRVLHINF